MHLQTVGEEGEEVDKFGITIAPFIAALGALTFGASFAVQGPLSNYGAGLVIILRELLCEVMIRF